MQTTQAALTNTAQASTNEAWQTPRLITGELASTQAGGGHHSDAGNTSYIDSSSSPAINS